MQASLSDTRMRDHHPTPLAESPAAEELDVDVVTPGLQNNLGEYNCFLNCILQCLWHCSEFRTWIKDWDISQLRVTSPKVILERHSTQMQVLSLLSAAWQQAISPAHASSSIAVHVSKIYHSSRNRWCRTV